LAALRREMTPSEATWRPRWSRCALMPNARPRPTFGRLARRTASKSNVSAGTIQRMEPKTPAEGPATKRAGSVV
jgi:hypothetical protein